MKLTTIIVDDEPRAHNIIENYVARVPGLSLVGKFTNALSAREFIQSNHIDLLFLDITMPEVNGFDLLKLLDKPPLVIFTTAHPEFAFESYDFDAVDYLKKPIPFERFEKAINKAIQLLRIKSPDNLLPKEIELKIDGETQTVEFSSIFYFQSLGNYIKVITNGKQLIAQVTTSEIEKLVPKEIFIRIHKSFIVNRTKIESLSEDEMVLNGHQLPIGKTFKKYVHNILS
jgi:DNA-binding LytR/AlgR family response regulator